MTLTFTGDADNERQTAFLVDRGVPDRMPVGHPTSVLGDCEPISLQGWLRWIAAALRSQLPGGRRGLPSEDRHLRRDIGLPEHEELPHYWDFTRSDR